MYENARRVASLLGAAERDGTRLDPANKTTRLFPDYHRPESFNSHNRPHCDQNCPPTGRVSTGPVDLTSPACRAKNCIKRENVDFDVRSLSSM